jgi:hypothetical protein
MSCSAVHSCAAWLQSCGSPGQLAVHSYERMLLFIDLRLCRPTSRIHSWGLQHTPARTYCSTSSCMRSKSQVRLPCQLISIILLKISSSFIMLLIDEQLLLPCCLLVLLLTISSSFIILLIDEQLRLPCCLLVLLLTVSNSFIILLIDAQLRLLWRFISLLWHWMPLPSCGSAGRLRGSVLGAFNRLLREHTARLPVVWDRNLSCGFHASLLVLYCSRLAVSSLDCSLMSSCNFHVVF